MSDAIDLDWLKLTAERGNLDDPDAETAVLALIARLREAERLLREVEWSGWESDPYDSIIYSVCPVCEAQPLDRFNADGTRIPRVVGDNHASDCALAAWLRDA